LLNDNADALSSLPDSFLRLIIGQRSLSLTRSILTFQDRLLYDFYLLLEAGKIDFLRGLKSEI